MNHYLFDMNRDWFAQTQIESRARVEAYLDWLPQVFADLHEMGSNGTYYFPPQAIPRNPNQQMSIMDRIEIIGRNNARWFDRMGFDFFNREVYDSFYPGYGASWPMYHGAMGMTFEQASVRGLARERSDDTTFYYRDSVQHHFVASLGTLEASADNRENFLRHFYDFHAEAISQGETEDLREILLEPGDDPNRAAKLASLLMSQGVEVDRAEEAFNNDTARDYYGDDAAGREFPAGTYRVSMAQPRKHLIKSLMAPETPMEEEFVAEQLRALRTAPGRPDLRHHRLVLAAHLRRAGGHHRFGLGAVISRASTTTRAPNRAATWTLRGRPMLLTSFPGEHSQPPRLWRASIAKAFACIAPARCLPLVAASIAPGSLIVRVHDNTTGSRTYDAAGATRTSTQLHEDMRAIATSTGADIFTTDTSWVEDGINLGSNNVNYLPPPRIALVYGSPASAYSIGPARYLLEQVYEYPVTALPADRLAQADLDRFNVIILPSGFYGAAFGNNGTRRLREWVQGGGTLVAIAGAVQWLTSEDVGLLETSRKRKTNEDPDEEADTAGDEPDVRMVYVPEEENPTPIPGAILRVKLNPEHFMAFGYGDYADVLVNSNNFFEPLTLNEGTNVGVYLEEEDVLVSGFVWEDERAILAGTPFLLHTGRGQGNVVAFTEEVNFRAYLDGLNVMFLNAVLLGPGY